MKKIDDSYVHDGYQCQLVRREGKFALFKCTKGRGCDYELLVIRTYKKDNSFTNTFAGDEYRPSTSEWGRYGWSYPTLEKAQEAMNKKLDEEDKLDKTACVREE